jgi:quercetin dioxygenase-like cupin family protein
MLALQTQDLELTHYHSDDDDTRRIDADWPIYRGTGAASTAVVYFELAPGKRLGTHTDSAEEVLVILEGEVEAVIDGNRDRVRAGGLVLVPAMVPHDVLCVGDTPAKVAGIFPSNTIISVFEDGFAPAGIRVVGTPLPEVDQEEEVNA